MTYIEILIDTSGSMGAMKGTESENQFLLPDGKTRMSLIKNTLREQLLPTLDYATKITIRTFKGANTQEQLPIVEKIYEGGYDLNLMMNKVGELPDDPLGGTPITAAITEAVNSLQSIPNSDRKIILLTDGEETGGGNYKDTIDKAFSTHGIFCKIFIVGICQGKEAEEKATYLSNKTKGVYQNLIPKSANDTNYISVKLAPLKKAILQDSLKNMKAATVAVTPQPVVTSQPKVESPKVIQTIKEKIETVKQESKQAKSVVQFEELELRIKEQIANGQTLLSELSALKELLRLNLLHESGIDATTLTIDSEYSENIRHKSETFLYTHLCQFHGTSKVKWMNQNGESGKPHDFELFDDVGKTVQLVECKGTPKDKHTFYLTSNEWQYFLTNKEHYQLYRVFNVDGQPTPVCIENLFASIIGGQVVPYLLKPEILKEGRVFLTLITST